MKLINFLLVLTALLTGVCSCTNSERPVARKKLTSLFPVPEVMNNTLANNIDLLGEPNSQNIDEDQDSAIIHIYEMDRFQMIITYNARKKTVNEVFLTTRDEMFPESVGDYYRIGSLNPTDSSYRLIAHRSMNDLALFNGLTIVKADSLAADP